MQYNHVFEKKVVPLQSKTLKQQAFMKKLTIALMLTLQLGAFAQDNTWEQVTINNQDVNAKYMAGAVPEVDGKVLFEKKIAAPGKDKKQIYGILLNRLTKMTKEPNQFEQSRIVMANDTTCNQIVASYQEWLVFKNKPLVLDRTRLFYHLIVDIADGEAVVKMSHIHYLYDEERQPTTFQAEEWITDRYGLNKKKTKLSRVSGKFRKKTIDRKDNIFNTLESLLNQ